MVMKTALITLVSTLVIAILAFSSQPSDDGSGWANGSAGVTGASANWSAAGGRGDWGRGTAGISGASGSYSGGGERGGWDDDDHGGDHDGDHDGGGWDDD